MGLWSFVTMAEAEEGLTTRNNSMFPCRVEEGRYYYANAKEQKTGLVAGREWRYSSSMVQKLILCFSTVYCYVLPRKLTPKLIVAQRKQVDFCSLNARTAYCNIARRDGMETRDFVAAGD